MAGQFVFAEPDGSESVFVILRQFVASDSKHIVGSQYVPDLHVEASKTAQALRTATDWHSRPPVMGHPVPRVVRWHQTDNLPYKYSNSADLAVPYPPELLAFQEKLIKSLSLYFGPAHCVSRTQLTFGHINSVLVNKYRDFTDSIGPHADNEPCFGPNPTIVSVTFGATRRFHLTRAKAQTESDEELVVGSKTTLDFNLAHNDVLIMAGSAQKYWLHSVPKEHLTREPTMVEFVPGEPMPTTVRFNLTFRGIFPDLAVSSAVKKRKAASPPKA